MKSHQVVKQSLLWIDERAKVLKQLYFFYVSGNEYNSSEFMR